MFKILLTVEILTSPPRGEGLLGKLCSRLAKKDVTQITLEHQFESRGLLKAAMLVRNMHELFMTCEEIPFKENALETFFDDEDLVLSHLIFYVLGNDINVKTSAEAEEKLKSIVPGLQAFGFTLVEKTKSVPGLIPVGA